MNGKKLPGFWVPNGSSSEQAHEKISARIFHNFSPHFFHVLPILQCFSAATEKSFHNSLPTSHDIEPPIANK
jgi:hypothetical protein